MNVDVIIPAGGAGKRMGGASFKQFLHLEGTPILARTLGVFNGMKEINRILLIVPQEEIEFAKKEIVDRYRFSKVRNVLAGGRERQDSVNNGISALGPEATDDDIVVIHDAVRPFVTEELILRSIVECRRCGAVALGVPVKDTVKQMDAEGVVGRTVDRAMFWLAQTPQTFRKSILVDAYRRAYEDGFRGTDDASLVERFGVSVRMVCGSYENIKITTPEDLDYGEYLLSKKREVHKRQGQKRKKEMRIGFGYDSHRLVEGRRLVLGGVEIPSDKGLLGHSDADALLHALGDAVLGALGERDIGTHFPDRDPAWKDISSLVILDRICGTMKAKGCEVNHVDATIVLEKPKLAPFVPGMIRKISAALGMTEDRISLKAKTNEGMGFTGRGEGIAVFAVVLLNERADHGKR